MYRLSKNGRSSAVRLVFLVSLFALFPSMIPEAQYLPDPGSNAPIMLPTPVAQPARHEGLTTQKTAPTITAASKNVAPTLPSNASISATTTPDALVNAPLIAPVPQHHIAAPSANTGGVPPQPAAHTRSFWQPALVTSWQLQYSGTLSTHVAADVYDIDLFDTTAATVAALHAQGRKVVCYVSAGSYEDWRPDTSAFPPVVLGQGLDGWPQERWLDIRRVDLLGPIMQARFDQCKQKGFDAIDPDNVDGYTNATGFRLTAQDQIAYDTFLAQQAHMRGLAIALKNSPDLVTSLVSVFDFTVVEQCVDYNECDKYRPFIAAGKPVVLVEYNLGVSQFCAQANALNFNGMRKHLSLDAYREACR